MTSLSLAALTDGEAIAVWINDINLNVLSAFYSGGPTGIWTQTGTLSAGINSSPNTAAFSDGRGIAVWATFNGFYTSFDL